jgi:hypothetical protein
MGNSGNSWASMFGGSIGIFLTLKLLGAIDWSWWWLAALFCAWFVFLVLTRILYVCSLNRRLAKHAHDALLHDLQVLPFWQERWQDSCPKNRKDI